MKKILLFYLCFILAAAAYSQTAVSGRVTGYEDEPLPGVNVLIKGASQGVITDVDGRYLIEAPENATLIFSYVGYVTEEIEVAGRSVIDVSLLEDIRSLSEVVVIGYGTSTKKELTGAVGVLNAENIESLNPQRIEQALQGQIAGVNITSASGSPGGGMNIRIRGLSTNGANDPLILVDGIPYSTDGLNALNPSDIESINVLKDATAGIYGVRAANGVIFITTKKGAKASAPTLEFNGNYGVQETARMLDLLNAREFAILKNEAFAAGNAQPPFNNVELGDGTDWQNEVFQQAPVQNYSLSINGGSDKTAYSIGGSLFDQEGIIGGDKSAFRRYNGRLNFITELSPKLNFENVLLYDNETRSTLPENTIGSVLYNAINASPARTVRTSEGKFSFLEEVNDVINPMALISNTFNETRTNKITGKQELSYEITNHFSASARAGYNYAVVDYKGFSPLVYYGSGKAQNTAANENLDPVMTEIAPDFFVPRRNNVTENKTTYFDYTLEAFLNYDRTFSDAHRVRSVLGFAFNGEDNSQVSGTAHNIPYNSWDLADISVADGTDYLNNTSSWQDRSRLHSVFLRGEYSYADKYLLSALIRRDASSRFGANNRFGYFPTVSAGWVISEEAFFPEGFFDFAKLRASYGILGNDRIGLWRYRALLGGEAVYPFNDQLVTGQTLGLLGNQDLRWEQTAQFNVGADVSILNDNLELNVDYYIKTTRDLLLQPDVSGVLGAYAPGSAPPYVNAGDIRNSGFEFILSYQNRNTSGFGFNASYNLTTIHNEVIYMPEGVEFLTGASFGVGGVTATRMEVGYPIGYFHGFKTDGVYQSAEEIASRGVTQTGAQPGDLRYVDLNDDKKISFGDNTDKTMIGSPIPDFTMGLNLGVDFKGIDFSAFLYSSIGNDILRNYERQQPLANQLAYRIARWTGEGSTNEHPRLTTEQNQNAAMSEYYLEDGSYLRIKNVQLGYTFPAKLTERIRVKSFRLYASANNLLTLTKYMGYDPDVSSGSPLGSGIDFGFYPQARTYSVGVNLKF